MSRLALNACLCVLTLYIRQGILSLDDVTYTFQDITFEWDSLKADENLHKHGVSFATACEVFFDPFVRRLDDEVVEAELRETILGMAVDWRLFYVVYVMLDDTIRLISARPTTKAERKHYED